MKQTDRQLLALRVKANRLKQFADSQQRNNDLRRKTREDRDRLNKLNAQTKHSTREVDRLQLSVACNDERLNTKQQEEATLMDDLSYLEAQRVQREMHTQREDLWRRTSEMQARVREFQSRVHTMEGRKRGVLGDGAYEAICAMIRFSKQDSHQSGPNRVLGPLVDSIDVDLKFESAADSTAGNTFMQFVFDRDGTAAKSVTIMKQQRADLVTLSPMIRLAGNESADVKQADPIGAQKQCCTTQT